MIEWKSVIDERPPLNKTVLLYEQRYGFVCTGCFLGEEDDYYQWSCNGGDASYEPTHSFDFWAEYNPPERKE